MKRATQIIIGILLGALVTAGGIGVFLAKANHDRKDLADRLVETQKNAEIAREENLRAVEEANKKLEEANGEVTRAEKIIVALEEERILMASAVQLTYPSSYTTYRWSELVSVDLGISLKIPAGAKEVQNSEQQLTSDVEDRENSTWLSIIPYSAEKESDWQSQLITTSTVSFLIQDRVVTGVFGETKLESDPNYVLRVQQKGVLTHLIWIHDPSGKIGKQNRVQDILATMTFK
ncbi:MAG: hypothetical protein NUV81_00330 [bacterium]|nr:hypothetical protein [bacterium]